MGELPCYTLINPQINPEVPSESQIRADLEKGDARTKAGALKRAICSIANGERMPNLLMTVIRFVLPLQDHTIKKLLLIFWEVVPKTSGDGKLLHEMILVCDAYRKDLQHPNEYIRGSTLRFLCKLKEPELLEPLMPSIRACLEHRLPYVRRNAVLAIYTIYKNFDFLIPDAPEMIGNFLDGEQDMACKRHAFMMLIQADQERALSYLSACIDQVGSFGDILQLIIVELVYKVCVANPNERARFIRCIYNLLSASSLAVRYEAAGTLVTLSNAPTAIKAAAQTYIELIVKESDNNVKLIVLDKLLKLRDLQGAERILQELLLDLLRVLSSPDLEVRKKTLDLALELVSPRNIEEMVTMLKREVQKTESSVEKKSAQKYRQVLVRTLHKCCVRFPNVAHLVIPLLAEFLGDTQEQAGIDVLMFFREAINFPELKGLITTSLIQSLPSIRSASEMKRSLWILGEYCTTEENIQAVVHEIRQILGELPIVRDEIRKLNVQNGGDAGADGSNSMMMSDDLLVQQNIRKLVTADGTYATQSAFTTAGGAGTTAGRGGGGTAKSDSKNGKDLDNKDDKRPYLRKVLMNGDYFTATALASALTKLALRYCDVVGSDKNKQNAMLAETVFILTSILHLGKSRLSKNTIPEDDFQRIATCLRTLAVRSDDINQVFEFKCRESISRLLQELKHQQQATGGGDDDDKELLSATRKKAIQRQVDDALHFNLLSNAVSASKGGDVEDMFELSLSQAIGSNVGGQDKSMDFSTSKLSKVTQLTGFSDPVYAEAYVNVNQYDVVLDILVVNQTDDTLESLTVELATLGDLKLVDKPSSMTLAPRDFANIKASVKVSSTENGTIFGSIVYDVRGSTSDRNCVVLNEIQIDIMDYIVPATCNDMEFREMWAEFEWENKVTVNTQISDLRRYLNKLMGATNMKCLTPEKALMGDCGFLAANLYAKSIFGEDALANISLEKESDDRPVQGHVRIRAKSQGMALSMGDRISAAQKKFTNADDDEEEPEEEDAAAGGPMSIYNNMGDGNALDDDETTLEGGGGLVEPVR